MLILHNIYEQCITLGVLTDVTDFLQELRSLVPRLAGSLA
jgi:hypothetical protein